jgi:hypothetical protein
MAGSATFTIVLSSMIMKRPKATAPSVHHLRFSGAKSLDFNGIPPRKLVGAKLPCAPARGERFSSPTEGDD